MKRWLSEVPNRIWISLAILALLTIPAVSQLNQSGGPGSTVTANQGGTWTVQPGNTANTTAWKVDGSAVTQPISGTVTINALPAGSAVAGYFRLMPPGCATLTSDVTHDTVGVGTGAGTSVSSVTGCVESVFVNNITNSAVTLRLADKTGTPIIWVGGNADFSIPANSNLGLPFLAGVTFTSGITAIAGTGSALNLHVVTRE